MTISNSNPGLLNSINLDFSAFKQSLIDFLSQQPQFKGYNFSGQNLNTLLDLLTFNTVHNALYENQISAEMWMDSAQQRSSIVSHAKELNYLPRSRTSSSVLVNISCTGNNLPSVVTIPANFQVTGRASNGQSFSFITSKSINVGVANNWTAVNVPVFEGRLITENFLVTANSRYTLQSANIDTSSIGVVVQNSNTDISNTTWNYATTLFGLSSDDPVFFLQGYSDNQYEVTFGNDVIGKALSAGNIVRISYRETSGAYGNGIKLFSAASAIPNVNNVIVTLADGQKASIGGTERETDEMIQFNGPRYFATQERAIISTDYITLLQNQFPQLQTVIAYGGEDAPQKQYGKVIISAKIAGSSVLPDDLKNQIVDYLSDKTSISISPFVVDPQVFNVVVNSTIKYGLSATSLTEAQIQTAVLNAIVSFDEAYLEKFANDLRYSKLVAAIDASDQSIISNDTTLMLANKFYPVINVATGYSFSFGNPTFSESLKGFVYPEGYLPAVFTSTFGYADGGSVFQAQIQDDGLGNLYLYTLNQQGAKTILASSIGTINYSSGNVAINSLVIASLPSDGAFVFYARLQNKDIVVQNNQILEIDPVDVNLTVVGQ